MIIADAAQEAAEALKKRKALEKKIISSFVATGMKAKVENKKKSVKASNKGIAQTTKGSIDLAAETFGSTLKGQWAKSAKEQMKATGKSLDTF